MKLGRKRLEAQICLQYIVMLYWFKYIHEFILKETFVSNMSAYFAQENYLFLHKVGTKDSWVSNMFAMHTDVVLVQIYTYKLSLYRKRHLSPIYLHILCWFKYVQELLIYVKLWSSLMQWYFCFKTCVVLRVLRHRKQLCT